MKLANILYRTALAGILSCGMGWATASAEDSKVDSGRIPGPVMLLPDGDATSLIVLLSDTGGWTPDDQSLADRLKGNGAIVVGIDTPKYLASMKAEPDSDCIYTISDIESVSQQLQRSAGGSRYLQPIIAGIGEGGALAQAMLAQSPKATISQVLAVDPAIGIPQSMQFCTPARKALQNGVMVYDLTDGTLPAPLTVAVTPKAPADGLAHVRTLEAAHTDDLDLREVTTDARDALSQTLDELIADVGKAEDNPLGLPLSVLDATPSHDTMAVIYSGDGGWRDIDRQVAESLQEQGIPVVGVDSLHYFWSKRTPEETSADLQRILHTYHKRWSTHHVLLIGYSFGADIMPAAYNGLPEQLRQKVAQVSLMALSHQVDYEVSVAGWLGAHSSDGAGDPVHDIARMPGGVVQCIYGKDDDETDNACIDIDAKKAEIVAIDGGHHFDGNYQTLAKIILDSLLTKLKP